MVYTRQNIQLHNCDNMQIFEKLENESIDVILTDPPYLYLKKQKLERNFNEEFFLKECKRVLTKDGFIALFGRGTSFYRWNVILAEMGFCFKEEIIWDKSLSASPLLALSRIHETISLHTKGKGIINKVKIPYIEMKHNNINSIANDIKRIRIALKNTKSFEKLEKYLIDGVRSYDRLRKSNYNVTIGSDIKVIDRAVSVLHMIEEGLVEKSIINIMRDHYNTIHPTQKPVRLLERILELIIPKDKEREQITIFDPFGGSFSTMEAVYNMDMTGISCEIDKEYFENGKNRIKKLYPKQLKIF